MDYIRDNLDRVREELSLAAIKAGIPVPKLIAVSKNHPAEAVLAAAAAGQTVFGENRIQEASLKIPVCPATLEWHLLGHLQSNKAGKAAKLFSWIQSIDKESTAVKLSDRIEDPGKPVSILIEINTSGDAGKNGIHPDQAELLAHRIAALPSLHLKGLMTIGPLHGGEYENRRAFALLRSLRDKLQQQWPDCTELSMGMTGDFREAVLEGSTIVRIGTAIFGQRS